MSQSCATLSPPANRPGPVVSNLLLAALPSPDRERIVDALEVVPLKLGFVLHKPGETIRHVYLPGGGFCSVITALPDGGMVEVASIGREGVVGVSAMLEGNVISSATMVRGGADACYRMSVDAFRRELARRATFYNLIAHYSNALTEFIMLSTACRAFHSVEQRLARWLLLAQDRMCQDEFPLTQEVAAMMLGASRPTVTLVAGALQRAGLITHRRGFVTILNREKLEAASCECYRVATELLRVVA